MTGLPGNNLRDNEFMRPVNQCDGCRAGYPRRWRRTLGGKISHYHVMGPTRKFRFLGTEYAWTDTMTCERGKYE